MKIFLVLLGAAMTTSSFAASKTIAQCAVNSVKSFSGVRVNLLQTEDNQYKINLIFGTTVSGTTYQVKEVSKDVFVGSIKNKPEFSLILKISKQASANKYINGHISSLEAVSIDLNTVSGRRVTKTTVADGFVCGTKVSNF